MTRKVLGCFLIFMALSLLGGCGTYNSLTGGSCYWENKVRHNLPTKLSKTASSSTAFSQKQLFTRDFGDKFLNKTDSSIQFDGDIYITGDSNLGTGAYYWKNGVVTLLDNGYAEDIYVENGIVYVAGTYYDYDNDEYHACYWRNGLRNILAGGTEASAIFVKDGVVYVAGNLIEDPWKVTPMYWVNDVKHPLDGQWAHDIYVDEINDVYVAGDFDTGREGFSQACYWKNDHRYLLDNFSATAILVRDSVLYVAGCDGSTQVNGIAVSGSDVYCAGEYYCYRGENENGGGIYSPGPCYWKNGELIPFDDGGVGGSATDIFISGDDVFIVGNSSNGSRINILWINGQPVDLGNFDPKGIFVIRNSNQG